MNIPFKRNIVFFYIVCFLLIGGCATKNKEKQINLSQDKFYFMGKNAMEKGNFSDCIKYFEDLEKKFPFNIYTEQVQINLPYCYWKDQNTTQAIASIDRFIQLHPKHENIDYVYYLKGLMISNYDNNSFHLFKTEFNQYDAKAAKLAFEVFQELITNFPKSRYTEDASKKMKKISNFLSENDVNIAKYYYNKKSYLAAIKRAQNILEKYNNTPVAEEALYILYMSYTKLEMLDFSKNILYILQSSFPESTIIKTGKRKNPTLFSLSKEK